MKQDCRGLIKEAAAMSSWLQTASQSKTPELFDIINGLKTGESVVLKFVGSRAVDKTAIAF